MRVLTVVVLALMPLALGTWALAADGDARSVSVVTPRCKPADERRVTLILRGGYYLACGPGFAVVRVRGRTYRLNHSKCFNGARLYFRSSPGSGRRLPPLDGLYLVVEPYATAGAVDVIDGGITIATGGNTSLSGAISGTARVSPRLNRGTFVLLGRSGSANRVRFTGSWHCG